MNPFTFFAFRLARMFAVDIEAWQILVGSVLAALSAYLGYRGSLRAKASDYSLGIVQEMQKWNQTLIDSEAACQLKLDQAEERHSSLRHEFNEFRYTTEQRERMFLDILRRNNLDIPPELG